MSRAPDDLCCATRPTGKPSSEMEKEAGSAGFYETGGRKFLKLQILTAAEVIDGKQPQVPFGAHRKPEKGEPRERGPAGAAAMNRTKHLPGRNHSQPCCHSRASGNPSPYQSSTGCRESRA